MKLSDTLLDILAGLPHVKKVWVNKAGTEFHLTAHAGWEEVAVNGDGEKTYADMDIKELRSHCDSRDIKYDKKDKEPALIALLEAWDADPNNAAHLS